MITGTSYFATHAHAMVYFRPYFGQGRGVYNQLVELVDEKIKNREIHIGKVPPLSKGQSYHLGKDGRYYVGDLTENHMIR